MKIKIVLLIVSAAFLILINAKTGFSQEGALPQATPEAQNEPETQWIWGEVTNIDPQNKMILVKYLDYETDQEKEINISVDDKTSYENIKSIDELKPKDTVSIDYIVGPDSKNIAKNISVEKPQTPQETQEGNVNEGQKTTPSPTEEEPNSAVQQ